MLLLQINFYGENMKVLIADAINEKGIENLKKVAEVVVDTSITPEKLVNTINEYDGIVVRSRTKVTREFLLSRVAYERVARPNAADYPTLLDSRRVT